MTLKALTGWTSTYPLLGDRCHRIMSCSRSPDADTCACWCSQDALDSSGDAFLDADHASCLASPRYLY